MNTEKVIIWNVPFSLKSGLLTLTANVSLYE